MADVVYSRQLPGGGTVWIETEEAADQLVRGVLAIERRTDPSRRLGHVPPVLARYDGPSPLAVMNALYEIARDNVAVARALQRWQGRADLPEFPPPPGPAAGGEREVGREVIREGEPRSDAFPAADERS